MGQGKRPYSLEEESTILNTDLVIIDRTSYRYPKVASIANLVAVSLLITDSTIIAEITDPTNWTNVYIGSIVGLIEGNYYFDSVRKIKYQYSDGELYRWGVNNVL